MASGFRCRRIEQRPLEAKARCYSPHNQDLPILQNRGRMATADVVRGQPPAAVKAMLICGGLPSRQRDGTTVSFKILTPFTEAGHGKDR